MERLRRGRCLGCRAGRWRRALMRRGDICVIDLDPVRGAEANNSRPAVIVSNDGANSTATRLGRGVLTVVPVTLNVDRVHPFQVLLPAESTGLPVDAKAQAEQVRSIDVVRVQRRLGSGPAVLMHELDETLRLHLALCATAKKTARRRVKKAGYLRGEHGLTEPRSVSKLPARRVRHEPRLVDVRCDDRQAKRGERSDGQGAPDGTVWIPELGPCLPEHQCTDRTLNDRVGADQPQLVWGRLLVWEGEGVPPGHPPIVPTHRGERRIAASSHALDKCPAHARPTQWSHGSRSELSTRSRSAGQSVSQDRPGSRTRRRRPTRKPKRRGRPGRGTRRDALRP